MSDFTMNSINLKDIYMLEEDFFVYPGELVILQGATGCNKSTLLQNWVIQFPTIETLYCNFEMGSNLTYRRFAQIAHSLSKWGIIDSTVNGNELSKAFNHLKSINQKFNIKELDRIISDWKPKLVLIDTIEDFIVEGAKDVTTVTHVVAPELKRLAMKYDIIIMTVQHLSKQGSATNDIHGGKGSSSIEQKADKVLRLSGDRTKQYRILESLKARDERPFKIFLEFDEQTFKLTQINVKG
jgi:predicted ATP-dependent serine protease